PVPAGAPTFQGRAAAGYLGFVPDLADRRRPHPEGMTMPLAPVSTVPDRLLHTLKREAMARRDIIGPFEWLSYAQDAVHAYCASSGHEFRGYHPHSSRSLVALVGRGHHDVPL